MYEKEIKELGLQKADIIAGIPSFNNEQTIAFVAEQIGSGLKKDFPDKTCLIINCDGGSTDNTEKAFMESKTDVRKLHLRPPEGITGKGNVFKIVFEFATKLKADVVIVDDSDLRCISPEWVKKQIQSVYDGYDYVTPFYSRYKYDGTITNNICYPLVYSLFGKDIRQPIGGDFAFSGKLADYWLNKCEWPVNAGLFGIDIFMTTNAILGGFKIAQLNLGAKIHDPKDPSKSLTPMFRQVISTLFKVVCTNLESIKEVDKIEEIPLLGGSTVKEPQTFEVDAEAMKQKLTAGYREHRVMMKQCLSEENLHKIRSMVLYDKVHITPELWAKIVYDYIHAFKRYEEKSSAVLQSFIPLWFGRTHTFVVESKDMGYDEAEADIKKQAEVFYKLRSYFFERVK
jgi:hypothetical protein